jgi:hypothetical protein
VAGCAPICQSVCRVGTKVGTIEWRADSGSPFGTAERTTTLVCEVSKNSKTRIGLATSAATVSGLQVLSTTWRTTDGNANHWKYVADNDIVCGDVYLAA